MPNLSHTDTARYERKFVIPPVDHQILIERVMTHPAGFSEIYTERVINNIYFDTPTFQHLRENIEGVTPRHKVRIRWYGSAEEHTNAQLELKKKTGDMIDKTVLQLKDFSLPEQPYTLADIISEPADEAVLPQHAATLYKPVVLNRYARRYFVSHEGDIRLTLDTQIQFADPHSLLSPVTHPAHPVIMELKYPQSASDQADDIAAYFPYRLSKSSKYEIGMLSIYPEFAA